MNTLVKAVSPLIRIGYWSDINRYYKISSPLLQFFQGDDIEVYVVIAEYRDPGLDLDPINLDISNVDIEVDINDSSWAQDDAKLEYTEGNGKVVKVNPAKGYFKFLISSEDSSSLKEGAHVFKIFFYDNDKQTRIYQDFFEILI